MNDRLIDWWRRRRLTAPRFKTLTFHDSRGAVPHQVPRQTIALVGTLERPKWAVFECPCGRGHQITLNLVKTRHPVWRISPGKRGSSVHPSVDAYKPYDCHYWIKDGRVRFTPR
ncbi:MAG: DUF6527 family protein [Actinomycetota bacterium]|nr:DUF6527 family protein [Actinomycetota bacterium]